MNVTFAWAAEIVKHERDENGDLFVYGKATGPDLDLDGQICDPGWLKGAMPEWMTWGNMREMHQPIAAGVGVELDGIGDDWWLKSKVIDPGTALKVESGVLKGYSVGIKNPKVVRDNAAPGGRIVGGSIVEVSYVDRPCNPTAKMSICKSVSGAGAGDLRPVEAPEVPAAGDGDSSAADDGGAGAPSDAEVSRGPDAASGAAVELAAKMAELEAMQQRLAELAKDAPADEGIKSIGRDVLRRVRKLAPDVLAKAAPAEDIASAQACIQAIGRLIAEEAQGLIAGVPGEACQIRTLLCAIESLEWFCEQESWEPVDEAAIAAAEELAGAVKDAPAMVLDAISDTEMGTTPDLTKTVSGVVAPVTVQLDRDTITKMISDAVTEATKAAEERVSALAAELAKVKARPVPGGPVLARTTQSIAAAEGRGTALAKAEYYDRLALDLGASDPKTAQGYRDMALAERAKVA